MWKNPAGNFDGCALPLNAPWSASTLARRPRIRPSAGGRDLAVHVVVPRERGGHQVLRPVLHPLDRAAGHHGAHDRADVPRVDGDLVAEPAADVRGDDPDLVLGQAGDQGVQGAVRVRGLGGGPDGELAAHRVEVGHRAAGLQRRRMRPRVEHVLRDDDVGAGEDGVGGRLVAGLPVEDVVVLLARQVVADHRGPGVERRRGVDHRGQRLVVDVDELEGVPRRVPVLGHDERDLLALEPHLVGGQDRLHVLGQGGHPGQAAVLQRLAGDHGLDPGVGLGGRGVDRDDPGVRERAAQDRAVQHAGKLDVVGEGALAADEAGVFLALDRPVGAVLPSRVSRSRPPRSSPASVLAGPEHGPDDVLVAGAPADLPGYAPRGSPRGTGRGCGPAATGRSASCRACRTRTAARGIRRSPAGPGRARRRRPGPPRSAPGARPPWPRAPCRTSPGCRPARPRRPRSSTCRSPSASRSGPGRPAGSGSAAAAARPRACSRRR